MADQLTVAYHPGDWIVHVHYGVGHIACIEEKELGGDSSTYYKVVTDNSTLWVPLDKADSGWFRPICTREEFSEILGILQSPPQEMNKNHLVRKRRIHDVKSQGSLQETARLVRDLWGRRNERQLNNTEETALRYLTDRLLMEWSVCMDVEQDEARAHLQEMLRGDSPKA